VRSYREQGKAKQDVIHLGERATTDKALRAWTDDVLSLQATRLRKAEKLRVKMDKLRAMVCQFMCQFMSDYPSVIVCEIPLNSRIIRDKRGLKVPIGYAEL
jgi:hypothetical protein